MRGGDVTAIVVLLGPLAGRSAGWRGRRDRWQLWLGWCQGRPGAAAVRGANERGYLVRRQDDGPALVSLDEVNRPAGTELPMRRHRHSAPATAAVARPEQNRSHVTEERPRVCV